MCLTGLRTASDLQQHEKHCEGVKGRPTLVVMPEEGKNILAYKNYKKQARAPFIIYADFEALVLKIHGCDISPEKKEKSYTIKTHPRGVRLLVRGCEN